MSFCADFGRPSARKTSRCATNAGRRDNLAPGGEQSEDFRLALNSSRRDSSIKAQGETRRVSRALSLPWVPGFNARESRRDGPNPSSSGPRRVGRVRGAVGPPAKSVLPHRAIPRSRPSLDSARSHDLPLVPRKGPETRFVLGPPLRGYPGWVPRTPGQRQPRCGHDDSPRALLATSLRDMPIHAPRSKDAERRGIRQQLESLCPQHFMELESQQSAGYSVAKSVLGINMEGLRCDPLPRDRSR